MQRRGDAGVDLGPGVVGARPTHWLLRVHAPSWPAGLAPALPSAGVPCAGCGDGFQVRS